MRARTFEELWNDIKGFSFDDPIGDALRSGASAVFDKPLGGIHELSRHICDEWTVEELRRFRLIWGEIPTDKKRLMLGGVACPLDPHDIKAWELWVADGRSHVRQTNFNALISSLYDTALLSVGIKCSECARDNVRTAFALDAERFFGRLVGDVMSDLPPPIYHLLEQTCSGVGVLVHDKMKAHAKRIKRGKESYAKGAVLNKKNHERAKHDKTKALEKVHKKVEAGERLKNACVEVCEHFQPTTASKKYGREWLPLVSEKGEPLKPDSLRREYNKRYGHKKKRDAKK